MLSRFFVLGMMSSALFLSAQEAKPPAMGPSSYRVDLKVQEAASPARSYSMLIDSTGQGNFRLGQKVAYLSGANQINYADVGVNIECRVREVDGKIILLSSIEFSGILPGDKERPTIAQTRINLQSLMLNGKNASLATVDDPATQRKLGVNATVTRID